MAGKLNYTGSTKQAREGITLLPKTTFPDTEQPLLFLLQKRGVLPLWAAGQLVDRLIERTGRVPLPAGPEQVLLSPLGTDIRILPGGRSGQGAYLPPETRLSPERITDGPEAVYRLCALLFHLLSGRMLSATVQNKLHYAVTHHTAAEIVYGRADSTKPNMGLTTWKNAPKGRIRKSDVTVAKNYLNETEMRNLNEIVTMYLDYAERQARRGNVMYMADWVKRLDAFLQFNEEDILHDKGKVTAAIAKAFAEKEFEKFRVLQDRTYQSDFDRLVAETSADQTE